MEKKKIPLTKLDILFLVLSVGLFIFALTQRCFCTEKDCGESGEGAALLISGCFGIFAAPVWFAWLANPTLLFAWIYYKKVNVSLLLSLIASLICLSFLKFDEMIVNEGGTLSNIISYEIGYWVWLSSVVVLFISNCLRYIIKRSAIAI